MSRKEPAVVVRAEYRISESISGVPMVTVLGVIDRSTVGGFCDMLEIAEKRGTRGLIVYLEETTYLCTRAFETLALVNARLAAHLNRMLIVVCSEEHFAGGMLRFLSPQIRRVPTLVAALHAVRAAPLAPFEEAPVAPVRGARNAWGSPKEPL